MSFRLKAAIFAAFALSAAAAATASDMSIAAESIASVTSLPGALPAAPSAGSQSAVIFAPPREITQPLASAHTADSSFSTDPSASSLAALVDAHGAPEDLSGDMQCLAGAVYFESKGESLEGQLAVARVVINRARSGRFPDSLCGVVYQRSQFSFVRGNSMPPIRMNGRSWREAVAIAQIAMDDSWDSRAEGALFFHARRVSPGWGKKQLAAIDNHIFYR
ncbi:spore germination cell wall hydrolase CwlJ-like protein [Sphingobium sp. OAS761]|uniref:cell wall hydrolase n=1 Tax=Sphingobium sp. OAS761 TaxID=2817901 RepID=UPI00209D33C6|nr:cell wall hydrolase [Sphingobium sp. OAS761]MCP1470115.1 spore germination cell wall hydrolase CwlJ-like protein [Sphingobium sp. OAS761]